MIIVFKVSIYEKDSGLFQRKTNEKQMDCVYNPNLTVFTLS